jgi:hypothetical protein
MTQPASDDLRNQIQALQKRLDAVEPPYEDMAAWRIAESARKHLYRGLVLLGAAITLAGIIGFREIVSSAQHLAQNRADTVFSQEYHKAFDRQLNKRLAEDSTRWDSLLARRDHAFDDELARLLVQRDSAINAAQTQAAAQLQRLGDTIAKVLNQPRVAAVVAHIGPAERLPPPVGWAYYGIRYSGEDRWVERNFAITSRKPDDDLPKPGDRIRALKAVNVRADIYRFDAGGNAPVKGALAPGQVVRVDSARSVSGADGYQWVKFSPGP